MAETAESLNPELLKILVLPSPEQTRYGPEAEKRISKEAGLAYPVKDGVPMMMEEARKLKK